MDFVEVNAKTNHFGNLSNIVIFKTNRIWNLGKVAIFYRIMDFEYEI